MRGAGTGALQGGHTHRHPRQRAQRRRRFRRGAAAEMLHSPCTSREDHMQSIGLLRLLRLLPVCPSWPRADCHCHRNAESVRALLPARRCAASIPISLPPHRPLPKKPFSSSPSTNAKLYFYNNAQSGCAARYQKTATTVPAAAIGVAAAAARPRFNMLASKGVPHPSPSCCRCCCCFCCR